MEKIIISSITLDRLEQIVSRAVIKVMSKNNGEFLSPCPNQKMDISQLAKHLACSKAEINFAKSRGLLPFHETPSGKVYFLKSEAERAAQKWRLNG